MHKEEKKTNGNERRRRKRKTGKTGSAGFSLEFRETFMGGWGEALPSSI